MASTVAVLGIRHHGPGSARSVLAALDELSPSAVIIEGPPELDSVTPTIANPLLVPPVAALVYDIDTPQRASFYPLAAFSPEWVALRWAHAHGAEVRFADLSAAHGLALDEGVWQERAHRDPIGELAAVAGYDDPERWWEDAVEQRGGDTTALGRFAQITDAFAATRDAQPNEAFGDLSDGRRDVGAGDSGSDDALNLMREAAMRQVIRSTMRVHDSVAVVCGAYHAPALVPDGFPTAAADQSILKGLAKTKVASTWVPWTLQRLSRASGYGAGVEAPGWYQHLFDHGEATLASWFTYVARALRTEGLDVSPASAIESVRLAEALATIRNRPVPGLSEVTESTRTALCGGSDTPLQLVWDQLVVGRRLGSVPDNTPTVPLARDLARLQKALRLKVSADAVVVTLDLRQNGHLAKSVLFRRLNILGINWATQVETGRTTGTFKEVWTLEWRPELAIAVIDASLYGTTVERAATAKTIETAEQTADLATLSEAVSSCLLAELVEALEPVLVALDALTAHQHDTRELLCSIEPLARTCRYGDVRGIDTSQVARVLDALATRASVGLSAACANLDADASATMVEAIDGADRALSMLDNARLQSLWVEALRRVSSQLTVNGAITGRTTRILLDRGALTNTDARLRLGRQLSTAADAAGAAAWLDGFLAGEATLLLHDPELLSTIDAWISEVAEDAFDDLLPLVRRTFSRFSRPERRQIGHLVASGSGADGLGSERQARSWDPQLARPAVLAMAALLGLES